MSQQSTNLQVLLLPLMAQGHFIPFLALAKLLENKTNHTISLITTPLNIQNLKSTLPSTTNIRLTPLPFNSSDHGLPPFIENTASAPPHLLPHLIQASQSLQPAFDRLVADICRESSSVCIISDAFMSWSVETAKKYGVFHCVFNTMGAFGTAVFMSLWTHFPHRQIQDDEFRLPDLPNVYLHRSQLSDVSRAANGSDLWSVFFRKQISFWKETEVMLVNTVEELEEKALEQLRIKLNRVLAIGPVIPSPSPPSSWNPLSCINWLNQHPPNSVLYVSFGSQNSIHSSQMMELAKGLEASEKPFIWVIKPPIGFDLKDHEFSPKWLPEGFEDRMTERKRGLLVKTWAPQMDILSHGSTGAFLSHCGWNSMLESLSWGVPIIGWPLSSEQFFNSKLVEEELGAGVEVARGSKAAEIGGVDVARIIGLVMDGESEKGREVRKRAKELMEMMKAATEEGESCKGSSMIAMEEFFEAVACCRENGRFQ